MTPSEPAVFVRSVRTTVPIRSGELNLEAQIDNRQSLDCLGIKSVVQLCHGFR